MKVCRRCHIEKEDSEFRIRVDNRKAKPCTYLNNECMACGRERAAIYRSKKLRDPEFMEKNRQRARAYALKNCDEVKARRKTPEFLKKHANWELQRFYRKRDEINAIQRERRKTPEYKAKMKAYREKNKEKIYQQEVITKKRYAEKHRDAVTDEYVIRQLVTQDVATREMLEQPENYPLIEAKRLQILIKRKIKEK